MPLIRNGGEDHQDDFTAFDEPHHLGFVDPIRQLTGGGREEGEGQNEQCSPNGVVQARVQAEFIREPERKEGQQPRLKNLIVKRAQRLDPKQGRKSPLAHQGEQTARRFGRD